MSFWRWRLYFWPFGNPDLQAFWCQSIKMYDFYTPRLAPNGSDYIAQNASKRGFFANHSGMRRRSPPNGRKGIRASDTRLSSRGPHSGRWCATGAPHPGTGVPWRGSYADSRPRPLRTAALRGCPWRVCPKSAPDGLLHQGAPARYAHWGDENRGLFSHGPDAAMPHQGASCMSK